MRRREQVYDISKHPIRYFFDQTWEATKVIGDDKKENASDDFTLENYRRLIDLALSKGFMFISYTDISWKAHLTLRYFQG